MLSRTKEAVYGKMVFTKTKKFQKRDILFGDPKYVSKRKIVFEQLIFKKGDQKIGYQKRAI